MLTIGSEEWTRDGDGFAPTQAGVVLLNGDSTPIYDAVTTQDTVALVRSAARPLFGGHRL